MKKDKNDHNNHNDLSNEIKIEKGGEAEASEPKVDSKLVEELNQAKAKIEQLEKESADFKDKYLRRTAEFENYKRRTENDQLNLIKYAAESFIVKLLPAVDDFERSLQYIDDAKDVDSIKQGIKLVYDKLIKVLDDQGVKKIESVGKPFDVQFHEAIMQRNDDRVAPHTVLDEVEKGYIYKDKVIRHTKVIVSADNSDETSETAQNNSSNREDK
ncbi:MAG: nucleotide exchange factor GrpE [Ignavibacteriaceae bacterium]|nr:nucleotide exchange factor GrpE [Ignavibacteriaceae bacterium]